MKHPDFSEDGVEFFMTADFSEMQLVKFKTQVE